MSIDEDKLAEWRAKVAQGAAVRAVAGVLHDAVADMARRAGVGMDEAADTLSKVCAADSIARALAAAARLGQPGDPE